MFIRKQAHKITFMILVLFAFVNLFAINSLTLAQTPDQTDSGGAQIVPMAAWPWATAKKATTIWSVPYDGNRVSIATLSSGDGFFVIEREYGYYYIERTVNGKFQRGYVKMSDVNSVNYSWSNHNVYFEGTTKFTGTINVLSGPGTTNSYFTLGSISAGEYPLLILKEQKNTYNNIWYYYIQYKLDGNENFKRGWVEKSKLAVKYPSNSDSLLDENKVILLESNVSDKYIYTNGVSNAYVTQQPFTTDTTRQFKLEKTEDGFYRFVSVNNPNLSLQPIGNYIAGGVRLGVYTKGTPGAPNKAEEFEIVHDHDGMFMIRARVTAGYRSIDLYGGDTSNGNRIILSRAVAGHNNQMWRLQPKITGGNDIAIIKGGDSTGRAPKFFYDVFSNRNIFYSNKIDTYSSIVNLALKNDRFTLKHIKYAVKNSSFFYINGHGLTNPNRIQINNSAGTYYVKPSDFGFATSDRTRWGVLGPCDQLNLNNDRGNSAVEWATQALRKGVRGILGYYDGSPADDGDDNIHQVTNMEEFTERISDGEGLINAWRQSNNGSLIRPETNWAVIYHHIAVNDTLNNYNVKIADPSITYIHYVAKDVSSPVFPQASSVTVNQFISTYCSADVVCKNNLMSLDDNAALNIQNASVTKENGIMTYIKNGEQLFEGNKVSFDKQAALTHAAEFLKENNIKFSSAADFSISTISRQIMAPGQNTFGQKETLAYVINIHSQNNDNSIYIEVSENGVCYCSAKIG